MNLDMKIVICTTPIRAVPSDHPPFGSMAIIQALRGAGYDPYSLDIDCLRPSEEDLRRFFREYRPDVLGISGVDDEECYLLSVSDIDAADETGFSNLTDSDFWTVQSWRRRIILECIINYRAKRKLPPPSLREIFLHTLYRKLRPAAYEELRRAHSYAGGLDYSRPSYFNFLYALYYDVIASYLYPARTPVLWLWLLAREFRRLSLPRFAAYALEALRYRILGPRSDRAADYRSVRKLVDALPPVHAGPSEAAMAPLRSGR